MYALKYIQLKIFCSDPSRLAVTQCLFSGLSNLPVIGAGGEIAARCKCFVLWVLARTEAEIMIASDANE